MSTLEVVLAAIALVALGVALASIHRGRRIERHSEERRRAERGVLAMGGDGLVVLDATGVVIEANEVAEKMLWPEASAEAPRVTR